MIALRKMTPEEFRCFARYSVENHARDLAGNGTEVPAEVLMDAEKEFRSMLPDGPDTPDNHLMMIIDCSRGEAVGVIWYLMEFFGGVKQLFLADFVVKKDERRKGYGTAALHEVEKAARENGCTECVLYVHRNNPAALALYRKIGYREFREDECGMYMKKVL